MQVITEDQSGGVYCHKGDSLRTFLKLCLTKINKIEKTHILCTCTLRRQCMFSVTYRHDKLSVDKLGLHETDRVHRVQKYRNKLEHTQY